MHPKIFFRSNFFAACLIAFALLTPGYAQDYSFNDAVAAYKSGQYDTALKICDELPYDTKVDLLRGYIYLSKNDAEKAEEMFKDTLTNNRFYTLSDYARFEIIKINYYAGKFDAVITKGDEFISLYPASSLLPNVKNLVKQARKKGNAAAPATPPPAPSGELTQTGEAAPINAAAPPTKPIAQTAPAENLFNEGLALFDSLNYGPAQTVFKKLMHSYPKSRYYDDALLMIGRCEFRMGQYKAARKTFRKVMTLDRDTADDAQFYLGFVYAKQGNLPRAIKAFQAVVRYFPHSDLADDAQFYIGYYYEVDNNDPKALAAYGKLLKNFKHSDMLDDVALKVGMQQYSKGDYAWAYATFKLGFGASPNEDFADACLFWQAKCAKKLGQTEEANELLQMVFKNYDHTYYAFRARDMLASSGALGDLITFDLTLIEPGYTPKKNSAEIAPLLELWKQAQKMGPAKRMAEKDLERAQRFNELVELGQYQYAAKEIIGSSSKLDQRTLSNLGILLAYAGEYTVPVRHFDKIIKSATTRGATETLPSEMWIAAYPLAYWPEVKKQAEAFGVDPYLVLAIMREESRFDPSVTSRAYARGLMQIMSRTGKRIAKKLDLDTYTTKKLYEPELNIKMGTFYISQVLQGFSNQPALALAGYNGGPGNVSKWSKSLKTQKIGAGLDSDQLDIDEFIEHIPYRETRNYVKRVLKTYYEYKRIYDSK
ncbi:MAG: transglycosylase SLT domain-containing protein [Candidatus Margulisiibacteriota bacterium]